MDDNLIQSRFMRISYYIPSPNELKFFISVWSIFMVVKSCNRNVLVASIALNTIRLIKSRSYLCHYPRKIIGSDARPTENWRVDQLLHLGAWSLLLALPNNQVAYQWSWRRKEHWMFLTEQKTRNGKKVVRWEHGHRRNAIKKCSQLFEFHSSFQHLHHIQDEVYHPCLVENESQYGCHPAKPQEQALLNVRYVYQKDFR